MSWQINYSTAPITDTATLISFSATNPNFGGNSFEVRITGTGLSYDVATGSLVGTITSMEIYNSTTSTSVQTIAVPVAVQGTIADSLSAFLNNADVIHDDLLGFFDIDGLGFTHFGAVTLNAQQTSFTVNLLDSGNAVVGSLQVGGTGLSDPADVTSSSTGTFDTISLYDTSNVLVSTSVYGAQSETILSYAFAVTGGNLGSLGFFFEQLMDGDNTWTGGAGVDDIVGGAGIDTLSGGDSDDFISGGAGDDTITGGNGVDTIDGGDGDDTLNGGADNDTISGGAGNDSIDGGDGNDTMAGGAGDDTFYVNKAADKAQESKNEGNDTVHTTVDYTLGSNVENLILAAGSGNLKGTGNSGDNTIASNEGDNTIDGSSHDVNGKGDTVSYAFASAAVTVVLGALGASKTQNTIGAGTDTISGIENITGSDFNDFLSGNGLANILDGGAGNDKLTGLTGNDTYYVDGNDTIVEAASAGTDSVFSSADYTLILNLENLTLTGSADIDGTGNTVANVITGNDGANILSGAAGNDTLSGGAGSDTLKGGAGNDTYTYDGTDTITELLAGDGTADKVLSASTYTLGSFLENLVLTGSSAVNGTGNTLNNVITGNSNSNTLTGDAGNDTLDGGAGDDTLVGGDGNDTYVVDTAGDVVTESGTGTADKVKSSITFDLSTTATVENLELTGSLDINATGNSLANLITGNSGKNVLKGGDGDAKADTLTGGAGDDTYYYELLDKIVETAGNGIDTVISNAATYLLAANLENLTLSGTGNINGTGNLFANKITGNSGNNTIDGGSNDDTIWGGEGNDILKGGSGNDWVSYAGATAAVTINLGQTTAQNTVGAGTDTLSAFERVLGSDHDDTLTGSTLANILDGGLGNDTLTGGLGNDTYYVDNADDVVVEAALGGTADKVVASFTFDLADAAEVENLTLGGAGDIDATGSNLANVLTGNSGANTLTGLDGNDILDGGTGADDLIGGNGNDTYIVDNALDTVTEAGTDTADKVQSYVSFDLSTGGTNIETLELLGTAAINGTGNSGANTIIGNASSNILSGGAGDGVADTLKGGAGSDTYLFETGDIIVELAGGGTDTIKTATTYTLGANLENLTLTGTSAINGTGNTLANVITGNSAANTLTGGGGADYFVFNTAIDGVLNVDTIADFNVAADTFRLDKTNIFTDLGLGKLLATTFHSGAGAVATTATEKIIYDTTTGALYYDNDGNGANAMVQFAVLTTKPVLTHADFEMI